MSRKRLFIFGVLLPIFVFSLPALGIAQDAYLENFEGGKIDGLFHLRSTLLTGAGTHIPMRGSTAPAKVDPFIVFGNPAALGQLKLRQVALAMSPQVEFDVATFTDPEPTVKEEVKARLNSFDITGEVTYPEVTGTVGRSGAFVNGIALAVPIERSEKKWIFGLPHLFDRVAFGYYQPFHLRLSTLYTGLRTRLRTIEQIREDEILLYAAIKMNVDLEVRSDSWILSTARQFDEFWVGVGVSRTDANIEVTAGERTDGIMSKNEIRSSFNNPEDEFENSYLSRADFGLNGSSWAMNLGATYQPSRTFLFGMNANLKTNMAMTGPIQFAHFMFPALNFFANEGEKRFDVNQIEDPSELTRTYPKTFETDDGLTVNIPSAVSVAATVTRSIQPSVTFTKYFGELSYEMSILEDGAPFSYKRGVKPNWSGLLSLNLGGLQLALGGVELQDVVDGYHDDTGVPIQPGEKMIVPRFSMGFNAGLNDDLTLGMMLFGLPEDALRLSLLYSF